MCPVSVPFRKIKNRYQILLFNFLDFFTLFPIFVCEMVCSNKFFFTIGPSLLQTWLFDIFYGFKVFFWSLIIIWSNPVSEKFQISLQVRISPQWWLKLGRGSAKCFILHVRPSWNLTSESFQLRLLVLFPIKYSFLSQARAFS